MLRCIRKQVCQVSGHLNDFLELGGHATEFMYFFKITVFMQRTMTLLITKGSDTLAEGSTLPILPVIYHT
jgi:hypothetical protein